MKQTVNLTKTTYNKTQYPRVIDTQFTQLIPVSASLAEEPLPTVGQFFEYYEQLFYDIPELGNANSHEYLIRTSTEYIGFQDISIEIQALQEEITSLRQQLLDAQQQLIDLNVTQ
jgi:hypothetical protein